MAVQQMEHSEFVQLRPARSLWLIWKSPETGWYSRMGQLHLLDDQRYAFSYDPDIREVAGICPQVEFPDLWHPILPKSQSRWIFGKWPRARFEG